MTTPAAPKQNGALRHVEGCAHCPALAVVAFCGRCRGKMCVGCLAAGWCPNERDPNERKPRTTP